MEMMVYNYGQTKSKEDKTKMLHKGARQILIGFFWTKTTCFFWNSGVNNYCDHYKTI